VWVNVIRANCFSCANDLRLSFRFSPHWGSEQTPADALTQQRGFATIINRCLFGRIRLRHPSRMPSPPRQANLIRLCSATMWFAQPMTPRRVRTRLVLGIRRSVIALAFRQMRDAPRARGNAARRDSRTGDGMRNRLFVQTMLHRTLKARLRKKQTVTNARAFKFTEFPARNKKCRRASSKLGFRRLDSPTSTSASPTPTLRLWSRRRASNAITSSRDSCRQKSRRCKSPTQRWPAARYRASRTQSFSGRSCRSVPDRRWRSIPRTKAFFRNFRASLGIQSFFGWLKNTLVPRNRICRSTMLSQDICARDRLKEIFARKFPLWLRIFPKFCR